MSFQRKFKSKCGVITYTYNRKIPNSHVCGVCNKQFSTSAVLKIHNSQHTGEKPHTCKICGEGFIARYLLNAHVKVHDGNVPPKTCEFCNRSFPSKSSLLAHRSLHTGSKCESDSFLENKSHLMKLTPKSRYECSYCRNFFYSTRQLEAHAVCHIGEKYTCDICDKKFSDNFELNQHYMEHVSQSTFTCDICSAGFNQHSDLLDHRQFKHTSLNKFKKQFKCDICNKSFEKPLQLDEHFSTHIGRKPFVCEICNVSYAIKSHFEKHNQVEHPPFSDDSNKHWKRYVCKFCPLGFVRRLNHDLHVSTHKQEKNKFACKECEESFSEDTKLEEHYLDHIKEHYALLEVVASHGCNACFNFFSTVPELKQHMSLHDDSQLAESTLEISVEDIHSMLSDVTKGEIDLIHKNPNCLSAKKLVDTTSQTEALVNTVEEHEIQEEEIDAPEVVQVPAEVVYSPEVMSELRDCNIKKEDAAESNKDCTIEESIIGAQSDNVNTSEMETNNEIILSNTVQQNIQIVSHSDPTEGEENSVETFYIITENEDGTFSSSILDDNYVIVMDETGEIQNIQHVSMADGENVQYNTGKTEDTQNSNAENSLHINSIVSCANNVTDDIRGTQDAMEKIVESPFTGLAEPQVEKSITCGNDYVIVMDGEQEISNIETKVIENRNINLADSSTDFMELEIQNENSNGAFVEVNSNISESNNVNIVENMKQKIKKVLTHVATNKEETIVHIENTEISVAAEPNRQMKPNKVSKWKKHTSSKSKKPITCDICNKSFTKKRSLKNHYLIHTGEKPYVCRVCNRAFRFQTALHFHYAVHSNVKPYACTKCDKTFAVKSRLTSHLQSHENTKPFACEICGIGLGSKHSAKLHSYKHMPNAEWPFKCEICGEGFIRRYEYDTHLMVHRGEPLPHTCKDCGKVCRSAISLRYHRLQHTGEKPYSCEICNKAFTRDVSLRNHYVTHTNEGRFRCKICGKPFHNQNYCNRHMKIHSGSRDYVCDLCGAAFTQQANLNVHKVKHTRKDPYICDVCRIGFKTFRSLRAHKQKIHHDLRLPSTTRATLNIHAPQ